MLQFLLALISPLSSLASGIVALETAKLTAQTDVAKAEIDKSIQQLNDQRDVIVASMATPITRDIYWTLLALGGIGPVAYILKTFLWDKTIGSFIGCSGSAGDIDPSCHIFNTDKLGDPNLWWITIAVFGFLFLTSRR